MGSWGSVCYLGGGGGPILVHIDHLLNNNVHVKYRSNRGHVGPLHTIQGYQGHRNVSKCKPHHSGDIYTRRTNNLKTSFSYMGQNVKLETMTMAE